VTDTPAWFEDEYEPRPRRRLVVAGTAVVIAWVAVAVAVLVLGTDGGQAAGSDPARVQGAEGAPNGAVEVADPVEGAAPRTDDEGRPVGADELPVAGDEDGPAPGGEGGVGTTSPGATTVSRDAAEAIAVAVARAWLSDGGPDLRVPGIEVDRRAYLEHVSVEGFDLAGPDLAVARLQLVLLVRDGEHYTEVLVRRAAVPLLLSAASVAPAGQPWFLPGAPELTTTPPGTTPLEDPEVTTSVAQALVAAGYLEVEVGDIEVTPDGSLVAQVLASTTVGEVVDGPVWLAPTPSGLVLLGSGSG
jgi:hypothetical protein